MKLLEVLTFRPTDKIERVFQAFNKINKPMSQNSIIKLLNSDNIPGVVFQPVMYGEHQWSDTGIAGAEYHPTLGKIVVKLMPTINAALQDNRQGVLDRLYSVLVHELVHDEQAARARAKNPDAYPYQTAKGNTYNDYLSLPHEITAMAAEIISELNRLGYTADDILKAVTGGDGEIMTKSIRFNSFIDLVNETGNTKPIKRLYKRIVGMLQ